MAAAAILNFGHFCTKDVIDVLALEIATFPLNLPMISQIVRSNNKQQFLEIQVGGSHLAFW